MFRNYLVVALRNLRRNPLFSLINILGLAIGLACCLLIVLYVQHETSYDRHWQFAPRTWKVMRTFTPGGGTPPLFLATNAPQAGPLLAQDFPELEHMTRIMNGGEVIVTDPATNQSDYETGLHFADANVFSVFDIPFVAGDPETALQGPMQMVISQSLADRYFPEGNALGSSLLLANQAPIQITGIMADLEDNTHLQARGFISITTLVAMFGEGFLEDWSSNNFHTYVVVPENYAMQTLVDAMPDFFLRHVSEAGTELTRFDFIPLTDIHLHSQRDNELSVNGNIVTVYTFSAIAVVILLIACCNFMNLSTARSVSRAREVGLRKTLGAGRQQLVLQFLSESVILTLLATAVALSIAWLALDWFNALLDLQLTMATLLQPGWLLTLLLLAVGVGVLAGSYPAFFLSAFSATSILRGELTRGAGGAGFRQVLVVLQFAISIALIIASGIAVSQLRFALTMDPGFTREQIITYAGNALEGLGANYPTMKQELLRHPDIVSVTAANLMPGDQNTNADGVQFEGGPDELIGMAYLNVDYDFFETFDIGFLSGRSFSRERGTDLFVVPDADNPVTTASFILNAAAAEQIGFTPQQALDRLFTVATASEQIMMVRGPIVGVVDNIYFSSLHEAVKPVFYRLRNPRDPGAQFPNFGQMAVRISGNNVTETLDFIARTWRQFLPSVPLRQEFMDEKVAALYANEERQAQLFGAFAVLAVFIAGLGLFGLAAYMTEQRAREIGIRKVLGSSTGGIVLLITRDFSKLVLLANLIAWPAAWYFMNGWLQNFAYRTGMNILLFVLAGLLAWLIAATTVGSLAARTANVNPTQSLRHE